MKRLRNASRAPILSGLSILASLVALSFVATISAQDQTVYEVGKQGDAPDPPKITPLTEREICGDWKAEKIGGNESPVDDLYIYIGEKGVTVEGKYKDWQAGSMHSDGEISLWRKPKAEEMSDKAPQWAREKVAAEGKLEWKMTLKAESRKGEWVLDGKWYPGQFKWSETGEGETGREATYVDQGNPVDVKFKKVPAIVRTAVLNNQTGFYKGLPWHPYPFVFKPPPGFGKRDSYSLVAPPPRNGLGEEGDSRMLFVCGISLPTSYDKKIEIRGSDNTIKYLPLALAAEGNLSADNKRLLKAGWDATLKGLDSETEKTVRKCAAMLVRADLQRGITPGVKKFTLDNQSDSWRLRFGDDGGLLTFARDVADDNEDIDCACLPEKIYIEVRTETPFPTGEIPLRVQLNEKEVTWNGAETIIARHVKDVPTPSAYEVPRAGEPAEVVPKVIRVYRTATIQLGGESASATKGYHLAAKAEDTLRVKPDDPYLFSFRPGEASLKIWDGPDRDSDSNLIGTWQETIARAAFLDGLGEKVKAGQTVTGSEGAHFSNVVVTNIAFGKLRPAGQALKQSLNDSLHSWTTLTPLWAPALAWRFFFGSQGILTERVTVTVADHAALLVFKEAFIRKMSIGLKSLEFRGAFLHEQSMAQKAPQERGNAQSIVDAHRAMLLGLREGLKMSAVKESSPWESVKVPGPNGGEVKFSWALDDGLRKAACKGMTDSATEDWSLKAVENGIDQYKDNIRHAIQKAKDTPDNDVKKLIELIGYGYENLAPEVMQHMMWHGPPSLPPSPVWVPNLNARRVLWNLHTAADALRAQEELSKLDTQMVMLAASALAAPFMLSENLFVQICMYAMDVAAFEGQLITETVPELWEQYNREEIRFAIGASLVLGTERLNEAEAKRTEWYQTALNVLPAALGVSMGAEGLHQLTRANAKTKAALVLEVLEKHGLEGAKRLSNSDKVALIIHSTEAETVRELGGAKMLEQSHERATAAVRKLAAEAGAARGAASEAKTNLVKATGSDVIEAPKPLSAGAEPAVDKIHKADVQQLLVSGGESEPTRLAATEKYPLQEFPPERPTNVQKPTEKYPPQDFPPEKPTNVQKPTEKYPPQEFPPEKPTDVQKPKPEPAKPQPREKTPRVLRTADEFRDLLHPMEADPSVQPPPPPPGEGLEVSVRIEDEMVDITLGKKVGEGGFAGVWEIAEGPPKFKGKVVKLTCLEGGEVWRLEQSDWNVRGSELEKRTHLGYKADVKEAAAILNGKNATGKRFEHAAIQGVGADENAACVIQDRIKPVGHPKMAKVDDCLIVPRKYFVDWGDKYGLTDAVIELFWELKQAGVVWEDGKLGNIYFRKKADKWVAGILDVDRIYLHADRAGRRGAFLDWVESCNVFYISHDSKSPNVNSLDNSVRFTWGKSQRDSTSNFIFRKNGAVPGPYFKDAEEFMMVMFEYQGWIRYDKASGKYVKVLMDPEIIYKKIFPGYTEPMFPKLIDQTRFKPRNLDAPYVPPPKSTMLRPSVIPGIATRAFLVPARVPPAMWNTVVYELQAA